MALLTNAEKRVRRLRRLVEELDSLTNLIDVTDHDTDRALSRCMRVVSELSELLRAQHDYLHGVLPPEVAALRRSIIEHGQAARKAAVAARERAELACLYVYSKAEHRRKKTEGKP